ncbi:calcium-binding protein [Marinicaulis aureus]|uniref:Calcium-binding protein n=1 Tax=Hyphococcus aureus TaxID=2666033 RepID=A0ABW1KTG5_9PROT
MWTYAEGNTSGASQGQVDLVMSLVEDAANYWGRYLDFHASASLDVLVNIVSLGGDTLAQAGTDFFFQGSSGGSDIYQAVTINEIDTGADLNGGSADIEIDVNLDSILAEEFYYGGEDEPGVPFSKYDLFTVLLHEIGHGLGFLSFLTEPGTDKAVYDLSVQQLSGDYYFTGATAVSVYGSNVPLDTEPSHIATSPIDLLGASLFNGQRLVLSALDLAILADAGLPVLAPTSGADVIYGFESSLYGVSYVGGDDNINLLDGADVYYGLSGDDTIRGGGDNDTIEGGAGFDLIYGDNGDDYIDGGSENDDLRGSAGNDTVLGGYGRDVIRGNSGDDDIRGGAGGDTLAGGLDNDEIRGASGDDAMKGEAGNDLISSGIDDDLAKGNEGADTLLGGDGNDFLQGNPGDDMLFGQAGNDDLRGGNDNDTLDGGSGNDTLRGNSGDDVFVYAPGADDDLIIGFEGGAGAGDVIDLSVYNGVFDSFADVQAAAVDDGFGNVVIELGGGDSITLANTIEASLNADDFLF